MKAPGLPTPKVGERVVSVGFFDRFREHGVRQAGFTDPNKLMSWVAWDDGTVSGEFTKSLVREVDYPKTLAGQMEEKK
jgi:hypothetical protein